jgi:hypothetical protein
VVVRRLIGLYAPCLVGALVVVSSCSPTGNAPVGPQDINSSVQRAATKQEPPPLAPRTNDEIEKVGIPVYLGSSLDDKPESVTIDETSFRRVIKVKMFAPADTATVGAYFMAALKSARKSVIGDNQLRIDGKSKDGDDVEFLLGPAADPKHTVVLAWLTHKK